VRQVLLVRPHDFIVESMSSLMRKAGFEPIRFKSISQLEQPWETAAGAVISTAVTSSVPVSLKEAYTLFRARHPTMPLAVASLARDTARALPGIWAELGRNRTVVPAVEGMSQEALGRPDTLLLLLAADVQAAPAWLVEEVLPAHFQQATG